MLFRQTRKYRHFTAVLLSALFIFTSCREDDLIQDGYTGDPEDLVGVTALVQAPDNTRADVYIEEGEVTKGTFLLHYHKPDYTSSNYFGEAYVEFGNVEGPNVGYAYTLSGDTRKDLKWKHIYNNGTTDRPFYLSNVDRSTYSESNSTTYKKLRFNQTVNGVSNNPYVASPLDEEYGKNDLLVASANAKNTTSRIQFSLEHILSLLKVNVEVFSAESDNWSVDLKNARIFISNLCTTTGSVEFYAYSTTSDYRHTFSYSTSTAPSYSSPYGGTYYKPDEVSLVDSKSSRSWGKINEPTDFGEQGNLKKTVYESQRFIFPPQSIPPSPLPSPNDVGHFTGHPVLTVRVPKADATGIAGEAGDSIDFSGTIPQLMFDVDANGNIQQLTPQAIALKSGCQLTVTAAINSPETSLVFAPVKVEAWVAKNTFNLKTTQGGIYKASDFYALIDAYNRGDELEMIRYGYHDPDGNFVFQLWTSLKVDEDRIRGMMKPGEETPAGTIKPDFSFAFNSNSLTLMNGETALKTLTDVEGEYELYNILTGNEKHFQGIQTSEELSWAFSQITNPRTANFEEIRKYAWINNADNTITFDIKNTVSVCIDEIFQKLRYYTFWDYDLLFNIPDGKSIRVTMPDAPGVYFEVKNSDSYDLLRRVMVLTTSSTVGVLEPEDFYFLIDVYNKFYPHFSDLLKLYGSYNAATANWSFNFKKAMSLDGTRAYLSMIPDPELNRPDFSFEGTNYSIVFTHPLVPSVITSFYVEPAVNGMGSTSYGRYYQKSDDMKNLMPGYKSNAYDVLWDYGRFDSEAKKWTFRMSFISTNAYQNVAYSSFYGSMIIDEQDGKYDYDFDLVEPLEIKNPVYPSTWDGDKPTTMRFYQNGSDDVDYPNTAADLKLMAEGKYWDAYPNLTRSRSVKKKRK